MEPRLSTLTEVEAAVWSELARAARDREHAWRTPALASVSMAADGTPTAEARTVVLREVDPEARHLLIYTDSRAGKVAQLRAQPVATLLMWSKPLAWQLRCRVRCEVEDDGLAVSSRWARIKLSSAAQDYLSPLPPGSQLQAQTPAVAHPQCFAVITAQVERIDWLELHREGHRRAVFGDGAARWVQP